MNDYKRLLVLNLAIENCLGEGGINKIEVTTGQYYQLVNIKKWVNGRLNAIEDKENVVRRLEGRR